MLNAEANINCMKSEKMSMTMEKKFDYDDIYKLQPSLIFEKEIYMIEQETARLYLEIYLNTDYGCEYELYGQDYDQIDGGVVDNVDYENEFEVVKLILDLLNEMGIKGKEISKMAESQIPVFDERADLVWKEKIEAVKRELYFSKQEGKSI